MGKYKDGPDVFQLSFILCICYYLNQIKFSYCLIIFTYFKKVAFLKRSPCLLSGLHWETLEDVKAGIDTKHVLFLPCWLLRFPGMCRQSSVRSNCWAVSTLLFLWLSRDSCKGCFRVSLYPSSWEQPRLESKPPCCRQSQEPPTLAYPVPARIDAFLSFLAATPSFSSHLLEVVAFVLSAQFGQYTNEESTMVLDIEPLVAEDSVDTMYPRAQLTFSLEPLRPQTIAPSPSSSCPGQSKGELPQNSCPLHPPTPFWISSIVVLQQ